MLPRLEKASKTVARAGRGLLDQLAAAKDSGPRLDVAARSSPATALRSLSRGFGWCQTWRVDSGDVRAFFEQVSARWDDMRSSFYNADVIDALAEHGRVTAKSQVVDVGTGTGFVAAGLAGQAATVIGIDNSPAMLAVAADNLAALGVDNVQLAEGELDNLRLPDDSVDVAVANMVLHHAPDPARMLAEMARVVRPGGTIAITDEVEHPYEWMRTEQADIWLGFTPEQVEGYFQQGRLAEYGYSSLGMQ
jgi:ubiquinone/menaquinone biosynthesis C-methylase UbiE